MFSILTVFLVAVGLQLASVNGQGFTPDVPSECQALGYCDRPLPDYPNEAVHKLVEEAGLVSPGVVDVTQLSRRQGVQDPSEVNLCDYDDKVVGPCARSARIATTILLANPAVKQQCLHCCVSAWRVRQPVKLLALETILPQIARDTNGKWNYIVNTQEYKQGYRVQICRNVNSQCSPTAHFYAGYTASCQQRFISVVMVALAENGQKTDKDFKIPSNCYCQVKQS